VVQKSLKQNKRYLLHPEENLNHLKIVFDTIRIERLFVNLDMIEFCRDKLVFLGNIISKDGVWTHKRQDPY